MSNSAPVKVAAIALAAIGVTFLSIQLLRTPQFQAEAIELPVQIPAGEVSKDAPAATPPATNKTTLFFNEAYGFTVALPEGHYIPQENSGHMWVLPPKQSPDDTPTPEMVIQVLAQKVDDIKNDSRVDIAKETPIEINGVQGKLFHVNYMHGGLCPIYRLEHGGYVYQFSQWECLQSPIFESVVQSFRLAGK